MLQKAKPYLIIIGAILVVYIWTTSFGFIYFDEEDLILNRQSYLQTPSSLLDAFAHNTYYPSGSSIYYRPLQTVSYALDSLIAQARPFWFHLTNLWLHALGSILLYLFFIELKYKKKTSLLATLIFAVHPVMVQAVAWVPGRNDLIFGIFALASFIFLVKYINYNRLLYLLFHGLFFVLALFSKETAVVIPFAAILTIILIYKQKRAEWLKKELILAWVIPLVIWFIGRSIALKEVTGIPLFSTLKALVSRVGAIFLFLGNIVFPFNIPVLQIHNLPAMIIGILLFICLLLLIIWSRKKNLRIVWGLAWFVLFLLPTLASKGQSTEAVLLTNRMYIPTIGILVVLMEIKWPILLQRLRIKQNVAIGVILGLLSVLTILQSRDYRSDEYFWRSAVRQSSSLASAHDGLGSVYYREGIYDKALDEHLTANKINPSSKRINNNIGADYVRLYQFDNAIPAFLREIELNPTYAIAHHNLALSYYLRGQFDEAEEHWIVALELGPNSILPYQGLTVLYDAIGRGELAKEYIQRIIDFGLPLDPEIEKLRVKYFE